MKKQPVILMVVLLLTMLTGCKPSILPSAQLLSDEPASDDFRRAEEPIDLPFPETHGPHPGYQTEWWYFTGNLQDETGRHFGYQFTIFRRALIPAAQVVARESAWAADQVYLGHFALSDVGDDQHTAFERFARGGAGIAGAQAEPFRVWLQDWQVYETADGHWHIQAEQEGLSLDVLISDVKGLVLQGVEGYSQKGPEPGNASYYYSYTRMETTGTITVPDGTFTVNGTSWMDHEFSTSVLSEGQTGWDWFSLQLDDNSELMLFLLREEDGSIAPFSAGTYVAPDGSTQSLSFAADDFVMTPLRTWRSSQSSGEYPIAWRIEIPALGIILTTSALIDDQENVLSYAYWEGAVAVQGKRDDLDLSGYGYIEMTGYATSMSGQL